MIYRRCGHSGIELPVISLGLWHNFGDVDDFGTARDMLLTAFESGVCHFDLANNYGPSPGSAEITFGKVLSADLATHRDEMFISSKAGHEMWPGVYGGNSSRKNLIASCDASLRCTGLEYFDVFYSHRYDGVTPVEETMQALIDIVRSGKALYAGISKYPPELQEYACRILAEAKVPCLLSQYRYSMFDRVAAADNFGIAAEAGSGIIVFSPLAQGLLTDEVSRRSSGRQPCRKVDGISETVAGKSRQGSHGAAPQRTCLAARTVAGTDGPGLDSRRQQGDFGDSRRFVGKAAHRQPRHYRRQTRLLSRRT